MNNKELEGEVFFLRMELDDLSNTLGHRESEIEDLRELVKSLADHVGLVFDLGETIGERRAQAILYANENQSGDLEDCLLYTSPSPRD